MSSWRWAVAQITDRLWFWTVAYALVGLATALVAVLLAPFIPDWISAEVGANAVEDILRILASSMLAVATFSLATMVSAFAASASTTTPRAAQLLVEDRTSQTAIATFIGAFLFSLVGLIALTTGLYGASGRLILFGMTIVVVLTVVGTLLKWVDHLSRLGRLDEILDRLEKAATKSLTAEFVRDDAPLDQSETATFEVTAVDVGYIKFMDIDRLKELAESAGGRIRVLRRTGSFITVGEPILALTWCPADEDTSSYRGCFVVGSSRSLEQDARYGLILLAEVASRALSPGVNDAGTAIDVIARLVRVLTASAAAREKGEQGRAAPPVTIAAASVDDIFDDVFTPIARDGAATVEVAIRLQRSLQLLSRLGIYAASARRHSHLSLMRAQAALTFAEDRDAVSAIAREITPNQGENSRMLA